MKPYDQTLRNLLISSRIGTGALIGSELGGLWWCLGAPRFWRMEGQAVLISYTAVGGKVEVGEEVLSAVLRETREELRTAAHAVSSPSTLIVQTNQESGQWVRTGLDPAPAILHHNSSSGFSVAAFWVSLDSTPEPSSEISGLVRIPSGVEEARPTALSEILKLGGSLLPTGEIPGDALLVPFGTAMIWARLPRSDRERLTPRELQGHA